MSTTDTRVEISSDKLNLAFFLWKGSCASEKKFFWPVFEKLDIVFFSPKEFLHTEKELLFLPLSNHTNRCANMAGSGARRRLQKPKTPDLEF